MKIKSYILTLLAVAVMAGCSDDFLNKNPYDKISSGTFWKTASDAKLALYGCYNKIDASYNNPYLDGYADNAFCQYSWESSATSIGAGDITPTLDAGYNYEGIRRFNYFLDNVDKAPISEGLKKQYKAEVRTIRALNYLNMAQAFGPVPLIIKSLANPADAMVKPTPEADVIKFVIDELTASIPDLPAQPEAKSRLSKAAALALKARAHLYYQQWSEAADAASQVMNMGFSLFKVDAPSAADLKDDYSAFVDFANDAEKQTFYKGLCSYEQQFWEKNSNNSEVILSVEYLPKDDKFSSGLNTLLMPGDVGGWSSITPTQALVNAYWKKDGTMFTPPTPAVRAANYNSGAYNQAFTDEFRNRDTRLYASILFPGAVMSYLADGYVFKWGKGSSNMSATGYNFRKMVDPSDPAYTADWAAPQDFPAIRYAEVLLTYAEAKNELSATPDPSVYDAIDLIRERAGMPAINRATVNTQALLREVIRNERRIELAGEGFRWSDMRRWGISKSVMTTIYALDNDKAQDRIWEDRFIRMPYPQASVDKNPNLVEAQKAKGY